MPRSLDQMLGGACSLPSARDRSNIIFGVTRSNYKERSKFKDNVTKKIKIKIKIKQFG